MRLKEKPAIEALKIARIMPVNSVAVRTARCQPGHQTLGSFRFVAHGIKISWITGDANSLFPFPVVCLPVTFVSWRNQF
jgi:hypothetical protein